MFAFQARAGWVEVELCWEVAVFFYLLQIGHCLLIAARLKRQASCPFTLSCVVLSVSKASSMAPRAWIWGFKMSGPASLFLLAASVLACSSRLADPVPYMARF